MLLRNRPKVFVIGFNKTGTTSIEAALKELGYYLGNQRRGEMLWGDIVSKNYEALYSLINSAEAFQDNPFSCPEIFKVIDQKFPGSKFILTVRDSVDQWYKSTINFESKIFGNGSLPSKKMLEDHPYCYKGWIAKINNFIFDDLSYNENI